MGLIIENGVVYCILIKYVLNMYIISLKPSEGAWETFQRNIPPKSTPLGNKYFVFSSLGR